MDLDGWLPVYREICADFGFDEAEDRRAAALLSSLLGGKGPSGMDRLRAAGLPPSAVLCGGAETLGDDLPPRQGRDELVVAADGATSALLENGILPTIIVTDLDGDVEDQVEANSRGSVVFVHAHGDNTDALSAWVPRFPGRVVGTCQCPPVEGVLNLGGFTDGDRAACILGELGVRRVRLAGFDLARPAEKPGRSRAVKLRKLMWARRILRMLSEEGMRFEPEGVV